jgi:hypothetical protein
MNTTKAFKEYQRNKFYNSIKEKTTELGFDPKYLPQEKDRTNFGYKLDWQNKTKEAESLLSKNGLEVYLVDSKNNPILTPNPHVPERPIGSQVKPGVSYERTYVTKRIKKSKTDFALYNNIKNYYESNNRFFNFTKKRFVKNPPVYEIIEFFNTDIILNLKLESIKKVPSSQESILDLRIDILSSRECVINGGLPSTNNFSYMLFGGNSSSEDPITVEEWCTTNQPNYY